MYVHIHNMHEFKTTIEAFRTHALATVFPQTPVTLEKGGNRKYIIRI